MKILIIDDDVELVEILTDFLSGEGFDLSSETNPYMGIDRLKKEEFDIVLLDVMMPGLNGFEVCEKIRKFSSVPILMLTARGETEDKITGLELGADDYLGKPFDPRELIARIKSLVRRNTEFTTLGKSVLTSGELEIDLTTRTAYLDGEDISLTNNEFEILALLMNHAGDKVSREKIAEDCKGMSWNVFDRSIDAAISRLRNKIEGDPKKPKFIKTARGEGYIFGGEVKRESKRE